MNASVMDEETVARYRTACGADERTRQALDEFFAECEDEMEERPADWLPAVQRGEDIGLVATLGGAMGGGNSGRRRKAGRRQEGGTNE